MKERIAITGSEGTISTVLKKGLAEEYEITPIDILIGTDVRDYQQLLKAIHNHQAIIHLAWNPKLENWRSQTIDPDNATMFTNAYNAALEAGVPRIVMASSIHADNFYGWQGGNLMSPYQTPEPQNPYGKDKVIMEEMGRDFAAKGLEVVCIRFGGINPTNKAPVKSLPQDMASWLSHNDCISLVDLILKAQSVPNNFAIVYGVSNNQGRIHDVSNPFGWVPQEKAEDFA